MHAEQGDGRGHQPRIAVGAVGVRSKEGFRKAGGRDHGQRAGERRETIQRDQRVDPWDVGDEGAE